MDELPQTCPLETPRGICGAPLRTMGQYGLGRDEVHWSWDGKERERHPGDLVCFVHGTIACAVEPQIDLYLLIVGGVQAEVLASLMKELREIEGLIMRGLQVPARLLGDRRQS